MALFASSLFVYMVVLIFMKWTINWNSQCFPPCLDPDGDGWGSVMKIEWTVCDQSGDGTCTRGVTPVLATTTLPPNATTTLADL
jgi:hypothetical protein